jgi:hypothetical protein
VPERSAPAALGAALAIALAAMGCAPALRPPPDSAAQIPRSATAVAEPEDDDRPALERARAAWARRPDPAAVREAESAFLAEAERDHAEIEPLIGAAKAKAWLAEHEPDSAAREAIAVSLVQTAQLCGVRFPGSAACDYWLGIALGVQARERPSTAEKGLEEMIAALLRADAADPAIDEAGPARVLALVYLRAPGWPLGPGDPGAALAQARRALAARPDYPPNLLAAGEALEKSGAPQAESLAMFERAREGARRSLGAGNPDAADWLRDAERALAR